MKKFYNLLIALAAVMMIAACGKEENLYQAPEKTIEIVGTDVVFNPEGGTGSINITSTGAVSAVSNKDWCVASVAGNVVSVAVSKWSGIENRNALVTLKSGAYSVNVTVQQFGVQIGLSETYKMITSKAQNVEVNLKSNVELDIKNDADWVTISTENGKIIATVTENNSGAVRSAEIGFAYGEMTGTFDIVQMVPVSRQTNWTLSYGGRWEYYGQLMLEKIINTVKAEAEGELYYFYYATKDEYSASGLSMADFVATVAVPKAQSALIENYEYYGGAYPISAFLYDSSNEEWYQDNFSGQYYFFAIGFDENGQPTGKYQYATATITPPEYYYFVGEWNVTDAAGYAYRMQIFPNVEGKSYKIRGPFLDYPIDATYNTDGTMMIAGSSSTAIGHNLETATRTYESLYLIGGGANSGKVYSITGASLRLGWCTRYNDNTIILNGGSTVISNNVYNYVRLILRGVASSKNYTVDYVALPAVLTKSDFAVEAAPALVPAEKTFSSSVILPKRPIVRK